MKKFTIVSLMVVLIVASTGKEIYSGSVTRQFSQSAELMGAGPLTITIIGDQSEESTITSLINRLFEMAWEMDMRLLAPETGILAKINNLGKKGEIELDGDLFEFISKARSLSAVTGGWFDITASSKKGFFSAKDYRKLKLNDSEKTLSFKTGDMGIDVKSIWPAFIVDKLIQEIVSSGFGNAEVKTKSVGRNIGRDIHTPWVVSIDIPNPQSSYAYRSHMYGFSDKAVSTLSPDSVNRPLTDPKSKAEVPDKFKNITVFADDAMTAQALAVAIYTLGPPMLLSFTNQHPEVKGIFLDNDGNFIISESLKLSIPFYNSDSSEPTIDRGPNDLKQKEREEENY